MMSFVGLLTGNIGSLLRARPIKPGRDQGSLQGGWSDTRHEGDSGKVSRLVALIAAMDAEDVVIGEPGNLRFPAKNLIFRTAAFRHRNQRRHRVRHPSTADLWAE